MSKPVLMCVVCGELPALFTPDPRIEARWCLACLVWRRNAVQLGLPL